MFHQELTVASINYSVFPEKEPRPSLMPRQNLTWHQVRIYIHLSINMCLSTIVVIVYIYLNLIQLLYRTKCAITILLETQRESVWSIRWEVKIDTRIKDWDACNFLWGNYKIFLGEEVKLRQSSGTYNIFQFFPSNLLLVTLIPK